VFLRSDVRHDIAAAVAMHKLCTNTVSGRAFEFWYFQRFYWRPLGTSENPG